MCDPPLRRDYCSLVLALRKGRTPPVEVVEIGTSVGRTEKETNTTQYNDFFLIIVVTMGGHMVRNKCPPKS